MPLFQVVLDELGVDVALGAYSKGRIRIKADRSPVMKFTAVAVTPISVDNSTTGTIKGGAIGLFLAGPLGAAIGSMMGGGAKVAFKLETVEGSAFHCVMARSAFVEVRDDLESRRQAEALRRTRSEQRTFRPRWLFWIATLLAPPATAWSFFRSDWSLKSRVMVVIWTMIWCLIAFSGVAGDQQLEPRPKQGTLPSSAAPLADESAGYRS